MVEGYLPKGKLGMIRRSAHARHEKGLTNRDLVVKVLELLDIEQDLGLPVVKHELRRLVLLRLLVILR